MKKSPGHVIEKSPGHVIEKSPGYVIETGAGLCHSERSEESEATTRSIPLARDSSLRSE